MNVTQAEQWSKWLDPNHIRLHAGEMTAQELRTVQAVVSAMIREATPLMQGIRCPNANDEQCRYPDCKCHEV